MDDLATMSLLEEGVGEEMYLFRLLIFCILIISFVGCAYYNTLFNAEARYEDGIRKIEQSKDKKITSDIRTDFQAAIDKCWKLINIYSDSSRYADDALLIIGKSHYNLEEYVKAQRFLAQFVDRYSDSDLIAEAYLWLGMSLIELDRDDEALDYLNKLLAEDESDDMNSKAHLNSGRIYLKRENFEQARKQFNEVFDLTNDDELLGNAQFLIAESYYQESNYTESTSNFEKVLEYDASIDLLFRAILRKVDSYLNLEDYNQAIITLESVSSETKFLHKKSVILAIIGNCYRDQGMFIEATEIYNDVLETHPRTEGSAIAAYGMGQLMEFAYADLDSAKGLYLRVGKEYRDSEYKEYADIRVKILNSYQKIVKNIEIDLADLQFLASKEDEDEEEQEIDPEDSTEVQSEDDARNGQKKGEKQQAKRSEAEIRKSLEKNNFAKAEFFLLTLVHYDSAAAKYMNFIDSSSDSILVPKAQYALYFIYTYGLYYEDKADSIKQIILDDYPLSPYAAFLTAQDNTLGNEEQKEESPYKYLYLQGEAMMSDDRYPEAIEFFDQIADEDSGSALAQKARYASAWIYENKLEDFQNAVIAYTVLAREYPNSEAGKIAQNKIIVPVQDDIDSTDSFQNGIDSITTLQNNIDSTATFLNGIDSTATILNGIDSTATIQDSTIINEDVAIPPTLEEQLDLSDQNNESQEQQDEQQVPDNPDDR